MRAIANVLNVAEKPSIAKAVAESLGKGAITKEASLSKYNPIFCFPRLFRGQEAMLRVTSVTGHIQEIYFDHQYKDWNKHDPLVLIESAKIHKGFAEDKKGIVENIRKLARHSTDVVLWLDCDREGEAIAYEVLSICWEVNPRIKVHRAHFSAATKADITHAYENLRQPDKALSDAVEVRQEIDLRIGAAFTRLQTLCLQDKISKEVRGSSVSYGPCQMPTLGFIVDRYIQIRDFIPEDFWYVQLAINRALEAGGEEKRIPFNWGRERVYDNNIAQACHSLCEMQGDGYATINQVKKERKTKRKPLPLTTVNLQKIGTKKLRMGSKEIMKIAEKLYVSGYISYPRTETDEFPKTINLQNLLSNLINFPEDRVKQFVNNQVSGNGFENPRKGGHNDQAHPPIHPVKLPTNLSSREMDVYKLVAKHFIACCSKDAVGESTKVTATVGIEEFHATGIVITEKNFLEIYPYDQWGGYELPMFRHGEVIKYSELSIKKGTTSPPQLLTEADLIGLMEKNQIGTDATIHEHIQTIQDRQYAFKQQSYFKPSNLGVSLVESYRDLSIDLWKPKLRADMEKDMTAIAEGRKTKSEVLEKYKRTMAEVFKKLQAEKVRFAASIARNVNLNQNLNGERADPEEPDLGGPDPFDGPDAPSDFPNHDRSLSVRPTPYNSTHNTRSESETRKPAATDSVCHCPYCATGFIIVRKRKDGGSFLSCNQYPSCKTSANLPNGLSLAEMTKVVCKKCSKNQPYTVNKVKLVFQNKDIRSANYCLNCTDKLPEYTFGLVQKNEPKVDTIESEIHGKVIHESNSFTKKEVTCYRCNEVGHFAPQCPQKLDIERPKTTAEKPKPKVIKKQLICSRCNQEGHLTHQCKKDNSGRSIEKETGYIRYRQPDTNSMTMQSNNNKSGGCFFCKEDGHWARDCPQKKK